MRVFKSVYGCAGVLSLALAAGVAVWGQDAPDTGPKARLALKATESHIGNLTGHAADGKTDTADTVRAVMATTAMHGENAVWLDPKPRDFTIATFKCRSTLTGTLPTDEDLYNSIGRGFTNSNMPIWNTLSPQQRANLVAYIKIFSPRWDKEKAGNRSRFRLRPPSPWTVSRTGKRCSPSWNAGNVTDRTGRATVRRPRRLPTAKTIQFVRTTSPRARTDSRFKCGNSNQDIYKIFMTGVDGTPMPSFADVIQPNDAWDLVHFLRRLQINRHGKENEVLSAAHGVIPPYVDKNPAPAAPENKAPGSGQ